MKESAIETAFARWCQKHGHLCLKLQAVGQRGFPDRTVFLKGGGVVFIEFKKPGGVLSFHQKDWIKRLRDAGFRAGAAYTLGEAVELVEG